MAGFRVGRKLGRTVYRQRDGEASDADEYLFDAGSREAAAELVEALNAAPLFTAVDVVLEYRQRADANALAGTLSVRRALEHRLSE